jgi:phosphatidylserine decarboxylase
MSGTSAHKSPKRINMITVYNRVTGKQETEKVYGGKALRFLYGDDLISRLFGPFLLHSLVKKAPFSALYGFWQKSRFSKKKVLPFIKEYGIDTSEFLDDVSSYSSFNDFFCRKLKPEVRPIDPRQNVAIIPADGRYYFYQDIDEADGFIVKGEKFHLSTLLGDEKLAKEYAQGSMVMARLCPVDYHRYHFPCDCIPGPTTIINGWLHSVNPIAVQKNVHIFTENKRSLCRLETTRFGTVLFLAIGATNVGSIHDTYTPNTFYPKGAEKGFFSFGASALILLFKPRTIRFDEELVHTTAKGMEILCQMGQSMGKSS